ncbi:MAG: tRNA (adenosine(37)-N6)-threonylcarbamoyltransferase complex transferase subunit TsaD [Peptoniphilus harei]|uniref:tRNA (adenosine(37)-N6)-threonylcarbamoyltransferase complex transferase subunit TsaD n=1 Tax=Peptoniphilus harei TaxID=54005 RepID=UPI0028FFF16A|nr:tRNA (adenosine(37)-N6)-threonylcarbamoyltransferase complex transferase subunit TsaD [Peptoniphilus harei]MDU1642896.1 tRNA (adenosine(37)-N6)-threonylcarbamoyltransferase complex transferase subunit TsaD [Peptoniphilus harei]MDU5470998.1 tRNA (adenosine(37)-N6)-threonylcarbamoyltransferase complex transferase subunit TsaD [Peptoniphilus harei]MDU6098346.1 tRNA (adenosine(37)-N6)-threonylcarbamoyltransferase complex transferase subunit TsaD [Peptoniphilus harei]
MKVLAVESSCDETSVAVVEDGRKVYSNVIASQIDTHKKFGGVVPEIASRQHVEAINTVLKEGLDEAGVDLKDIDIIAATKGPGLIGALLVGLSAGKTLALATNKPFVGVNHIVGHVCANYISFKDLEPPFIGLIISGGHTYLIEVKDYVDFTLHGRTVDDAVGEAFDKVARSMGIGYPGGPIVDKLAKEGKETIDFPRVMIKEDNYNFSFSGLKTAVLNYLNSTKLRGEEIVIEDVCKSFQEAVVDVLLEKSFRLAREKNMDKIVLCGGVSANSRIREAFEEKGDEENIKIFYPELKLCTDNAAMIASAAYYEYMAGNLDEENFANPNLGLE